MVCISPYHADMAYGRLVLWVPGSLVLSFLYSKHLGKFRQISKGLFYIGNLGYTYVMLIDQYNNFPVSIKGSYLNIKCPSNRSGTTVCKTAINQNIVQTLLQVHKRYFCGTSMCQNIKNVSMVPEQANICSSQGFSPMLRIKMT